MHDARPPSGVLVAFLPNAQPLNCANYTEERMARALAGIRNIHTASVEHRDPSPKNVLIVEESILTEEMVVWVNFDSAIIHDPEKLSAEDRERMDLETDCFQRYGDMLKKDQEEGLPPN
ncbi:MAG: hypothetical protein Q9163_002701 [Psora crenata]